MDNQDRKNEILNQMTSIEFFPDLTEDSINPNEYDQIPFEELTILGGMLASLPIFQKTIAQTVSINPGQGLYRLVFPEGVTGELAKYKDNSGYYIGTIVRQGEGIVGNARWEEVGDIQTVIENVAKVDPLAMAVATVVMDIEKKLDDIKEAQEEILNFMTEDKKAGIKADQVILADILKNYKHICNNKLQIVSNHQKIVDIQQNAKKELLFYHSQIEGLINKKLDSKGIHREADVEKNLEKLQNNFKYYRLAMFNYAFATYLEVLLSENFSKGYLDSKYKDLENHSYEYRVLYSQCYDVINSYSKSSIENQLAKSVAFASKGTAKALGKVPLIKKIPVNGVLSTAGEIATRQKDNSTDKIMEEFLMNRSDGSNFFLQQLSNVNAAYNEPVEYLFDDKNMYVRKRLA